MKRIFLPLALIAALGSISPSAVLAQTFELFPDAPAQISATVSLHYKGSSVWSGSVALDQGSFADIADVSGGMHPIPSDSALEALAAADAETGDFALSDLEYYPAWSALYVNCIDIAAGSRHACSGWQYTVNGGEPPMGADQYVLADGDALDFYFGQADADSETQSQSPATSPAGAVVAQSPAPTVSSKSGGSSSGGGGGWFSLPKSPNAAAIDSTDLKASSTPLIKLDISIRSFIRRYMAALTKML